MYMSFNYLGLKKSKTDIKYLLSGTKRFPIYTPKVKQKFNRNLFFFKNCKVLYIVLSYKDEKDVNTDSNHSTYFSKNN